jgi:parallel beta-helix repeat protein
MGANKKNLVKKRMISIILIWGLVWCGLIGLLIIDSPISIIEKAKGAILTVDDDGQAMYPTIQAAIDNANAGDTIRVWAGTYNENLWFYKTLSFIGNGTGNTTIDGGGNSHVFYTTADWVNVSGFTITGSGMAPSWGAGIALHNAKNGCIENNNFTNDWCAIQIGGFSMNNKFYNNKMKNCGIFIHSSGGKSTFSTQEIPINNTVNNKPIYYYKNSNMNNISVPLNAGQVILGNVTRLKIENLNVSNGSVGIQIGYSTNIYIANNTANSNHNSGIYIRNSSDNTILNNTCDSNYANGILLLYHSNTNIIVNNTCSNNGKNINGGGIQLQNYPNGNKITNNTCVNNYGGIILDYSNNNIIFKNNFSNNDQLGIYHTSSGYNVIENNIVQANGEFGIYFDSIQSRHNIMKKNTCSNNNYGIFFWSWVEDNIINNNNISSNSISGIFFFLSSNNNITANNFSNNGNGINLNQSSGNNITDNNILSNNKYGIWLESSSDQNIVKNNNILNNKEGIHLQSSSNATIHYNDIFNNTDYGVINTNSSIIVNATYNWWGHPSGPHDPSDDRATGGWYNPLGQGDNVSDYVKYEPWLASWLIIIMADKLTAIEDQLYYVDYEAFDLKNYPIIWSFNTNASWLNWGTNNHTLYGTPTNADVGRYWVYISVSDGFGGYDEHNFTLTVLNVNPSIITGDITTAVENALYSNDYNSDDDGQGTIIWYLTTNAICLVIDSNTGVLSGTPDNSDVGIYWVNVSLHDGNGGIGFRNFTLTVINRNDEPIIDTADITTINEDEYYEVAYEATEIDIGDILTWIYQSNATWLNWGTANHTLYGTPSNDDVGEYWVRINITDGNGGYDEHYFILTVVNANDRPTIDTIDAITTNEDEFYDVLYTATEIDIGDILTWTYDSNATWLNWGLVNHTLFGMPRNIDVGSYWIRINISDGHGGFDEHYFILTVINTNDPPTITTKDVLMADEDKCYEVIYTALDIDIRDVLEWTQDTNATWLNWGTANHTLYGTPSNDDVGEYWVRINITDGHGGYDEHYFILTVVNANDPPIIITEDKTNATVDKLYSVNYEAEDIDPLPTTLTWNLKSNASNWLTMDTIGGWLNGVPSENDVGTYWVNISVSDGEGGFDFHNYELTVKLATVINQNPVITMTDVIIATVGELYSVDYNATDDRTPADNLEWHLKTNASWLNIDPGTGVLSGTPTTADVGTYWVNVSVTDGENGWGCHNFTVTVESSEDGISKEEVFKKESSWIWLILIIIIIVIIIAIVIFVYLHKRRKAAKIPNGKVPVVEGARPQSSQPPQQQPLPPVQVQQQPKPTLKEQSTEE